MPFFSSSLAFSFSWIHLKADWYQRWGSLCILAKARPWRIWCVLSSAEATAVSEDLSGWCDMRHAEAHFFSLEIAKNARVHSPQIFHCYCFTLQAFRLILTICLVRFVNLFANELFDLSHICFCSFFVCVCFLRTEFLAFHKQKACYFRVTIFVGINREKRACIYIPAGMARDYSSFNLEVCQNKEHQQ